MVSKIEDLKNTWKSISEFPNYQINKLGEVMNTKTNFVLKETQFKNGYCGYGLSNDNGSKQRMTHRLVALTFITNPENLPTVNHKDLDKTNNKLSNLEWASHSDQIKHSFENNKNRKKLIGIKIIQITLDNKDIKQFNSIKEAEKELNIKEIIINKIYKNEDLSFKFKYSEDNESLKFIEGEEWKIINDINISNKGRIKNKNDFISYGANTSNGYYSHKHFFIHRLVAEAFIPNPKPNEYLFVNHKDSNKGNNNVENLEWVSASMNTNHMIKNSNINKKNERIMKKIIVLSKKENKVYISLKETTDNEPIKKTTLGKHLKDETPYKNKFYIYYELYLKNKDIYDKKIKDLIEVVIDDSSNINKGIIRPVLQIDIETNEVLERFNSIVEASEKTKIVADSISCCCNKIRKTAGGFKWEFEEIKDIEGEIWKEHESTLKVSNMGRIKYPTGRLTTPFINNNGYEQLIFKNKILLYHRLIASLFVKNDNNYFNIKHLDGNRLNNNPNNLKWIKSNH